MSMELIGLAVIFVALLAIVGVITPKNSTFPKTTKKLSPDEERALIKKMLTASDKSSDLVIYWTDTLALLTYAERKALEQSGIVVSLTPHEVLIEDPTDRRKIAVRRRGDPAAPRIPQA